MTTDATILSSESAFFGELLRALAELTAGAELSVIQPPEGVGELVSHAGSS